MNLQKFTRGFTLIEMVVVITIITLMLSIFLGNRSQYTDKLNLKNQAYNLLTYIRQAQVYSLGVRNYSGSGTQVFGNSYGVAINMASPSIFTYFIDNNGNGKFDGGLEQIENPQLGQGVVVNRVCGTQSGSENCSGIQEIDITFKRPNPTAIIQFLNNGGNPIGSRAAPARIYLHSPAGLELSVIVDSTGQISIK